MAISTWEVVKQDTDDEDMGIDNEAIWKRPFSCLVKPRWRPVAPFTNMV